MLWHCLFHELFKAKGIDSFNLPISWTIKLCKQKSINENYWKWKKKCEGRKCQVQSLIVVRIYHNSIWNVSEWRQRSLTLIMHWINSWKLFINNWFRGCLISFLRLTKGFEMNNTIQTWYRYKDTKVIVVGRVKYLDYH